MELVFKHLIRVLHLSSVTTFILVRVTVELEPILRTLGSRREYTLDQIKGITGNRVNIFMPGDNLNQPVNLLTSDEGKQKNLEELIFVLLIRDLNVGI